MEIANVLSITRTQFVLEFLKNGVNGDGSWCRALFEPFHPTLEAAMENRATRDPSIKYQIVKETLIREVVS